MTFVGQILNHNFSDNFKWITATTAPQFYHETTAKSKSERRDTLNDVEKPPSTDACNKRLLDTDSVVAQPVRKQPKLGLSQRPANRRVKQGEFFFRCHHYAR